MLLKLFFKYHAKGGLKMQKMLFARVPRPPKSLNDLHFSACFESYYPAVLVKYKGYLVLSWWS